MLRARTFPKDTSYRFILLFFISFAAFILTYCIAPRNANSAQVTLAWDLSTDSNVAGYKIHYNNFGGPEGVIDVGNKTTGTVSNLPDGTAYSFAVAAYDTSNRESAYSNWVINPPVNFSTDILWRNTSTGDVYLWLMNGVTHTGGVMLGNIAAPWQIVGVGDFNGDGKPHIVWRNPTTGDVYLWYMNGLTHTGGVMLGNIPGPDWQIVGPK